MSNPLKLSGDPNTTVDRASKSIATLLVLFAAFALWFVASRFKVDTDLGVFMPNGRSTVDRLLLEQLDRGATSNLIFLSLTGADPTVLAAVNKVLAEKLRESTLFFRVHNGEHVLSDTDRLLIADYRYLLTPSDLQQRFSEAGLRDALEDRLRGLASPLATLEKRFLRFDPTGEQLELFRVWGGQNSTRPGPITLHGVWFSESKQRSLMVLEMRTTGLDLDGQAETVRTIHTTFAELAPAGVDIQLTGPGVFAVETRDVIRADIKLLTVLATVLVGAFLTLAFRSLALTLYVFVPLLMGVLVATAAVLSLFDSIHGVTLAFGVTLTGIAVDYPIHLFAHLDGDRKKIRQHIQRIWPTLRIGAMTTIIAYITFVLSEFEGLKQLGVFAVAGLWSAAMTTRWLLPVVMPRRLPMKRGAEALHGLIESVGRRAERLRLPAFAVVVLAIGYLVLTERPLFNFDVDSLSPIQSDRRAQDRELRNDLGFWSGSKLLVIVAPSAERALQKSETLIESLDELIRRQVISNYDMAAQYLPSRARQHERQSQLPDTRILRERLQTVLMEFSFKPGLFEPFIEDVDAARVREALTLQDLHHAGLDARLAPLLFESGGDWVAPVLLHRLTDSQGVLPLTGSDDGIETVYLDLKGESTRVMATSIDRMSTLLGWGGVAIFVVLSWHFRSLIRPFRVLGPTLASVTTVAALLVLMGVPLTLFHLVSLLLVIGLGLDYALFFNRLTNNKDEWSTTFKALWVCCVTTVLVFGILVSSHTPPLSAIGTTVALGATLCLVFGAIWATGSQILAGAARSRDR